MQRLAKTKSPGVDVVTYDHRLAVQESDDENHVPTESDFFVVENHRGILREIPRDVARDTQFSRTKITALHIRTT